MHLNCRHSLPQEINPQKRFNQMKKPMQQSRFMLMPCNIVNVGTWEDREAEQFPLSFNQRKQSSVVL